MIVAQVFDTNGFEVKSCDRAVSDSRDMLGHEGWLAAAKGLNAMQPAEVNHLPD